MSVPLEKRQNDASPDRIEIRIRNDGSVYFSSLPAELLEVAASLNPGDATLRRRLAILQAAREDSTDCNQERLHEQNLAEQR